MSDWLAIDTAPKDGTWIWVYGERFMDEEMPPYGLTRWVLETNQYWEMVSTTRKELVTVDASHWDSWCGVSPTHWRLLAPPQEGVSGDD